VALPFPGSKRTGTDGLLIMSGNMALWSS